MSAGVAKPPMWSLIDQLARRLTVASIG